jgi:hypothetical protein
MLTTVDVLATANHYLLDAATAPAVLALAYATAAALPALAPPLRWLAAARPPGGEPRALAGHPRTVGRRRHTHSGIPGDPRVVRAGRQRPEPGGSPRW